MSTVENLEAMTILRGGEMIKALDERHRDKGFVRTPKHFEVCDVAEYGSPAERKRLLAHYELHEVINRLGEAPPLVFSKRARVRIEDVMLRDAEVPSNLFVRGRLVHRKNIMYSDNKATVVADLHFDPGDQISLGSSCVAPAAEQAAQ